LKDPHVDGKIVSKWIFEKWNGGALIGSIWLRIGAVASSYECGNEPSGSIKCGEFVE
jgi:hypothetical protein